MVGAADHGRGGGVEGVCLGCSSVLEQKADDGGNGTDGKYQDPEDEPSRMRAVARDVSTGCWLEHVAIVACVCGSAQWWVWRCGRCGGRLCSRRLWRSATRTVTSMFRGRSAPARGRHWARGCIGSGRWRPRVDCLPIGESDLKQSGCGGRCRGAPQVSRRSRHFSRWRGMGLSHTCFGPRTGFH